MGQGKECFLIAAAGDPPRPPGVLQIFQDAGKLLGRSWRTMLSIMLGLLLPYVVIFVGNYFTVTPLTADMISKLFIMYTKDPRSPEYRELLGVVMQDLRELTSAQVVTMLVSHLLTFLFVMATVYTVAMANKGEQVSLKDLLSRIRKTWKGQVATFLYVLIISFGYAAMLFVLIFVFAFISNGSLAFLALGAVATILSILLLVYLEMVWHLGFVVSVVENDCYGLAALGRASELIRGRRRLGFRLNLLLSLFAAVIFVAYSFVNTMLLPPGKTTQLVGGIAMLYTSLMMSVFMLAAYVVFYYECKRSHGEEAAMKESFAYTRVPTALTLDGALP